MYGEDYEYANSRLAGTCVRLDGKMVRIDSVTSERAAGRFCEDGKSFRVKLNKLDVKPFKLGYVNFNGRVSYLVRQPKRRCWRQGQRTSNTRSLQGFSVDEIPRDALAKTVQNEFPTFTKVLSELQTKDGLRSLAFHRHWAVDRDSVLWCRSKAVGVITDGAPTLNDKYKYLAEYLEECL